MFGGLLDLVSLKKEKKISSLSKQVAADPWIIGCKNLFILFCCLTGCPFIFVGQNGLNFKQYQEILRKDDLVKSVSKWSPSKGQSANLNKWQQKAMDKAIQEKLQLIQGPPGTSDVIQ